MYSQIKHSNHLSTLLPLLNRSLRLRQLFILIFIIQLTFLNQENAFAQLNQVSYPDWATRWPANELYEQDCGALWIPRKYGPFDYRTAGPSDRELVEGAHFSIEYQNYLKGQKKSSRKANEMPLAAGFGYTLWAFPNHPQALAAMEDLGIRYKTERLPESLFRVHCFFQRAVRFAADDPLVRAIYSYYYARRGMSAEAKDQIKRATELESTDNNVFVYIAFAHIEMKEFDNAATAAKQAYLLGYKLPGLKQRLTRAGKWQD